MDRVLDYGFESVVIIDEMGKVRFASEGMAKFLGDDYRSIINVHIKEILPDFFEDDVSSEEKELKIISPMYLDRVKVKTSLLQGEFEQLALVAFRRIKKKRKKSKDILKGRAVYTFDKIIGEEKEFLKLIKYCKNVADSRSTVFITGESGTGKEIFAQSIHNASGRCESSFIAVNCGAIPSNLIESELFGYEEGAFTGARKGGCDGKFYQAHGGTIFLDEIGEMPIDMQTKLLRVIEEKTITKIGGLHPVPIDVRIIAATNKKLEEAIEDGTFRKDLYYRINVIPIQLPPLRERKGDIPLLLNHIMKKTSEKLNKVPYKVTQHEMDNMIEYGWPGNIRELENAVEYLINTHGMPRYLLQNMRMEIPDEEMVCGESEKQGEESSLEIIEKRHILSVLRESGGNISKAAKKLAIGRNTLYRKLQRYNINPALERYCTKMK